MVILLAIGLALLVVLAGYFFLNLIMAVIMTNEQFAKLHEIERESEEMLRRLEDGD